MNLDDFMAEQVERVCPAPNVVSETALIQLRPIFRELLNMRVLLEDIVLSGVTPEKIEEARRLLNRT